MSKKYCRHCGKVSATRTHITRSWTNCNCRLARHGHLKPLVRPARSTKGGSSSNACWARAAVRLEPSTESKWCQRHLPFAESEHLCFVLLLAELGVSEMTRSVCTVSMPQPNVVPIACIKIISSPTSNHGAVYRSCQGRGASPAPQPDTRGFAS